MKRCSVCRARKDLGEFDVDRSRVDGRYYVCKVCRKDQRVAHAQEDRERRQRWYRENRQRVLADRRAYYLRNRERKKAYQRERYRQNPEKATAYARRHLAANRELYREWNRRRKARKRRATVWPIRPTDLAAKWRYWGGRCWICGGEADTWDHVKPLAKGGAHILANLRPACLSCNCSKQDAWPFVALS